MNINSETVERLAALSKLEISCHEQEQLSGELEAIVNYMDILSQLPDEPIQQADLSSLLQNVFRQDKVIPSQDRALLLANAPETDGSSPTVPKTVG